MITTAITSFLLACVFSAALTALAIKLSPRIGLVDHPDQQRKQQSRPIPLGGGAAVFLATVAVLGWLVCVASPLRMHVNEDWTNLLGAAIACAWIVGLGLLDDRFGLRGRQKLAGQVVAAGILIASGVLIRSIGIFGMEIDLGLLAIPVTLLWLTGAINALNLLDGMDGMATVVGLILSLAICALALLTHHAAVAVAALVFAGALLGFLPFNLSPAKIYLGDAGSMLIGIIVGCLSIRATVKGAGTVLLAAPLAVMTIPILDSFAAILRRRLAGQSIYAADRGHLHHRLLARFGNKYKVLACVALCSAVTCGFALLSAATKSDAVALVASFAVVATLAVTGWFGQGEFVLLRSRLWNAARSLVRRPDANNSLARESTTRIQGSRQWETLWATLTESADKLGLTRIHLSRQRPGHRRGLQRLLGESGSPRSAKSLADEITAPGCRPRRGFIGNCRREQRPFQRRHHRAGARYPGAFRAAAQRFCRRGHRGQGGQTSPRCEW